MNIHHIKTSYYCPQANGRVERFHKTLHSVMMKKIQEDVQTWDLYLNQTLAAVRFHVNESSKFSPFFLLYNRDVVLPLDTILKPRKRYVGEDMHKIALQQQHKSFTLVHRHMKEAKRKQKEYADRNSKEENFQIGDLVYLKNHRRTSKLDIKWKGFYRITVQIGPLTFVCRNQRYNNEDSCQTYATRQDRRMEGTKRHGRTSAKTHYLRRATRRRVILGRRNDTASENSPTQTTRKRRLK